MPAPNDNSTYGFSKRDAQALLSKIRTSAHTIPEMKPRGGGGGGSAKIVQTPGGGIAARSGTTAGSATCTEFKLSGSTITTNTDTITVYNIWPFAIPASMYILATKELLSNQWIALHPGVIDVRWDSPDLEETLDGTNYVNIDTAEVCS